MKLGANVQLGDILSEIHRYTEDAILISEAEPLDMPGPAVVFANRAFERMTGFTSEEIVGLTPRILQGPETSSATKARIRENLTNWQPIREQILNYRKDGTPFWVELSIVPVADETGWFRFWVSIQRDITKRKGLESEIIAERDRYRDLSLTDDLTGALNRRGLDAAIGDAASANDPHLRRCSLLLVDLDNFKAVNDRYGHRAGDAVLQMVARRMKQEIGPNCQICRSGGDEFILNCDTSQIPDLEKFIGRLRDKIAEPFEFEGIEIECYSCIGASSGVIEEVVDGLLLKRADFALYEAKKAGRGICRVFAPDMQAKLSKREAARDDLTRAIASKELSVVYMAKFHASTGEIFGLEALVRWDHPVLGEISPGEFLPLAEEFSLLAEVDSFVFETVLAEVRTLKASGKKYYPVSVNVSGQRLQDPKFLEDIKRLDPAADELAIELVETTILDDVSPLEEAVFIELRRRQLLIEVDDFGSGHASILGLTRINPDILKIDKRLLDGVIDDGPARKLIRLIVEIGSTLNVMVLAEGVETVEQARALRELGCEALQGYLCGRPQNSIDGAISHCEKIAAEIWSEVVG